MIKRTLANYPFSLAGERGSGVCLRNQPGGVGWGDNARPTSWNAERIFFTCLDNSPERRLFDDLTEYLLDQDTHKVVDYQKWKGLKTLHRLVLDVEAVARIHRRDSIVPAKRSVGWIYFATCCHIRGKTDAVTRWSLAATVKEGAPHITRPVWKSNCILSHILK